MTTEFPVSKETPLHPRDAAKFLGVSIPTLYKWRRLKIGPDFVKFGYHLVRYYPADLRAFVARHHSHVIRSNIQ